MMIMKMIVDDNDVGVYLATFRYWCVIGSNNSTEKDSVLSSSRGRYLPDNYENQIKQADIHLLSPTLAVNCGKSILMM